MTSAATATSNRKIRTNHADAKLRVGADDALELNVLSFEGDEALGRHFAFDVVAAIENDLADSLTETSLVGERAALHLLDADRNRRVIRGIVSDAEFSGAGHSHSYVKLRLSPLTWLLTQRANSRIFQGLATPDIVRTVLADHNLVEADLHFALKETYAPRDYCVQYRESDWNFLARLMEEEGMYFFIRASDGQGPRPSYENEFRVIPADQVFRPTRTTPRPRVAGPQTAVVVGPESEEIYTDKYGRVKVRFHWDRDDQLGRDGRKRSDSSCWIRVSQPWAGVGYGGITIPRIGQEVIVDFLEGDPDQPIITGRVYNGEANAPQSMAAPTRMTGKGPEPIAAMQGRPQSLPSTATRTSIRTNSTPGGGGANEITLDDVAGGELVYVNATKDFVLTIANDSTTTVGNDMKLSVGNCLFEFVAISHDVFIGINETQFIGCNRTEVVGCNETITVGMNRTEAVGMNETLTVGLNRVEVIGLNHTESIGVDMSLTVGKDIKIVAGNSITIVTGKSEIYMHQDGTIKIKGKVIEVEASTSLSETSPQTSIVGKTAMSMQGAATDIRGVIMHVQADQLLHMESAGKLDSIAAGENVIQGKPIKLN